MAQSGQLVGKPTTNSAAGVEPFGWRAGTQRATILSSLVVILIWLAAGGLIWQNHRNTVAAGMATADNVSLMTAAYAHQSLNSATLVLAGMHDWIAAQDIRSQSQLRQVANERRFIDALRGWRIGLPQIVNAAVAVRDGAAFDVIFETPSLAIELADRSALLASNSSDLAGLSFSVPFQDRSSKRWMFCLSRPITARSGESLGAVIVVLDAEFFSGLFRQISVGENSSISLFRSDGTVLATNNGSESGIVSRRQVEGLPAFVSVAIGEAALLANWWTISYVIVASAVFLTLLTLLAAVRTKRLTADAEEIRRLTSERRLLSTILETPHSLAAVVNRRGDVVHCNERFRKLLAPNIEPVGALRDPAVRGAEAVLSFAAGSGEPAAELDLQVAQPGEQTAILRFSLARQSLPDLGECAILIGHDETIRRRAEQAMAQSAKLVTLGEMTSGMAHELSQPLNVIRMAAQNALAELEPTEIVATEGTRASVMSDAAFRTFAASKFNRVVAQVDRAAAIISKMRIFGRAPKDAPTTFDLRDAYRGAVDLLGQQIRSRGIVIREALGAEPLPVLAHQSSLEQVIVNLLMNGRDALSDAKQSDKVIDVTADRSSEGRVVLRVADNGPGVPAAVRERIFEPFFTSKSTGQGTGLGLALAFGIVRDAGGTLSLLPGTTGAVFQIDLPAAPAASRRV